ncbi:MAG: ABC transporter ATP-binding protein [Armatimonadota bacterium]
MALIEISNLHKVYHMGEVEVHALRGVDLTVEPGEHMAIMGPSGSGKSTLMNLLGCLDTPTDGTYLLDGEDVSHLSPDRLAAVRNRQIGFVFQQFNLLSKSTALQNVELPLVYAGVADRRERAMTALERVGLGDRAHHRPRELSGGQQQRVAVARALVNNPNILMADEPTGNLDTKTGSEILQVFDDLNEEGITMIMVTHDPRVAERCRRVMRLVDGEIVSDVFNHQAAVGEAR